MGPGVRIVAPSLDRLAGATADTIYFSMIPSMDAVCVDRREGAFPIKTLTLRLGDRRPLGIGSGSLALLAAMRDEEIEEVVATQRSARATRSTTCCCAGWSSKRACADSP